nr:glycosyltransferase family 4 protein [Neobacillus sp. Marseille-Q6967]
MKVLYIVHESVLGGSNRSLLGLIDCLIQKGIKVYCILPKGNGEVFDEFKTRNITIYTVNYPHWILKKTPLRVLKYYIKLFMSFPDLLKTYRLLKNENIDIIHTNTSVIKVGAYLSKLFKVPHIWHLRELAEEDFGLRFISNKNKSIKFMRENTNKFICISRAVYEKYSLYFPKGKISIIYNGIGEQYIQKKVTFETDTLNFLIAGALKPYKGQVDAILAINKLVKDGVENIKLYIVGRGDNKYKEQLQKMINEQGIENHVKILNYTNNINEIRNKVNIELVCSSFEAFGRVTIEAMMSSNLVIASDTGANVELVKDGYNGYIYKSKDYLDLADKMKFIVNNPNLVKTMGENAYNYAIKNFTAEKNASEIIKTYKKVTQKINQ